MRRFPWFETILVAVVMSIGVYAALSDAQNLSWNWFTRDDAYYYFKVAQNISEGHGSTFDGINPTNGYHPLWMLICVPIFFLARFDLILPLRVLLIVMSGLSAATAILLYRVLGRVFVPAVGALAAVYWVFSFDVLATVHQQGLETGIAAFFVILLVHQLEAFERGWPGSGVSRLQVACLAVVAVLAMFSRLDLVFLAGMAGLWIVFRGHTLRFLFPLDIISVVLATLLAFVIRVGVRQYYDFTQLALTMVVLGLVFKIVSAFYFGLYDRATIASPGRMLRQLVLSALTGSVALGAIMLLSLQVGILEGSFSRLILLIDLGLTIVFFGLSRLLYLGLMSRDTAPELTPEKPMDLLRRHWRTWLSDAAVYFGIVLGALGTYMVWSRVAFGTASPVSGQIKQWWASLPGRAYGGSSRDPLSFFGIAFEGDANAWNPISRVLGGWARSLQELPFNLEWRYLLLLCVFAIIFYFTLLTDRQKARDALARLGLVPLLGGVWLQVSYYNAIGYAALKEWYWVGQLVIIVLTFSLMLGLFHNVFPRSRYVQVAGWIVAAYVGLSMGTSYWAAVQRVMPYGHWPPEAAFMDIVPLLEENTPPGSIVGMTGGGNVGYFIQDRTIVNMDGLINSHDYFEALQKREAGALFHGIGMDYVLANPQILDQQPYKGQFNQYMTPLDIYYGGKRLLKYGSP